MVALVGRTGTGKTTLTNLLLRFYDPTHGVIRIGGVDLRTAALRDLRSQIAVVTQEVILFNDTIRQNIAYGRPDATFAEIEEAAGTPLPMISFWTSRGVTIRSWAKRGRIFPAASGSALPLRAPF